MVNYEDNLPDKDSLNSYDKESLRDKERILYWKGKIWNYENELRLCFTEPNGFHEIPQGCIKTIYCGCKMGEADIEVLERLAKDLNAKFIILKRSIYNYNFESVSTDNPHENRKF